jgi:hypothetical protein
MTHPTTTEVLFSATGITKAIVNAAVKADRRSPVPFVPDKHTIDHTYNDVAYHAEAAAPHQLPRQPSRSETYQDEPEEFHKFSFLLPELYYL